MAWSITNAGTVNSSAGNSFSLSSLSIPAGSLIVVGVQESNLSAGTVGSVTDSSSNSYTLITQISPNNSAGQGGVGVFYFNNNASTVTSITYTRAGSTGDNALISVSWITGQAASPLDTAVTASAGGSSTTPSVTSGAPSVSGELLIGWWGTSFSTISFTQDTGHGWTSTGGLASASGNTCGAGGNQVTGSATTFAPTTGNAPWAAIVVGFKPAASPIINVDTSLPLGQALSGPGSYPVQLRSLFNMPAPTVVPLPFNQYDWPNPTPPYRIEQTQTSKYLSTLVAQDKLVPGKQYTDRPAGITQEQVREWFQRASLALLAPAPPTPPQATKSNANFTEVPRGPEYHVQLRTLINAPAPVFVQPGPFRIVFNQYDWPLPTPPPLPGQTWLWSYNQNLIGLDQLPVGENLTGGQNGNHALPAQPDYSVQLRTWIGNVFNTLLAPVSPVLGPLGIVANQYDWPVPKGPAPIEQTVANRNPALVSIVGPLGVLHNQYDWPLPPRGPAPIDQTFTLTSYFIPAPPVIVPARYFLLQPHYVGTSWIEALTTVTEGKEIPVGWVPTLMADPLNTPAVTAFYNAGPRLGYPGPGFDWQGWVARGGPAIQSPKTFWVQASPGMYKLTGLGAALPPIGE